MSDQKYLFEILLYWKTEEKYHQDYQKKRDKFFSQSFDLLDPKKKKNDIPPQVSYTYYKSYGGPWNYNQIVGAVKIYLLGNQLQGELWVSKKKRFQRVMKNKLIFSDGNFFRMGLWDDMTNEDINKEIKSRIIEGINYDKRLIPDFECFDNICTYIDWRKLIDKI